MNYRKLGMPKRPPVPTRRPRQRMKKKTPKDSKEEHQILLAANLIRERRM